MSSLRFFFLQTIFWVKFLTESMVNVFKKLTIGFKRAKLPESAQGKTALITGANRGIGLETAKVFAKLGACVIIGCRDAANGEDARLAIQKVIDPAFVKNILFYQLDLASFASIKAFACQVSQSVDKLDYLINNAGIMMCAEGQTTDGFESQFGVNYLGHFLLTHLLLEKVKAAPEGRIISLTSMAHNAGALHFTNTNLRGIYTPLKAYGQSKLATILWTRELAHRLARTSKVTAYSVHPGLVNTDLYGNLVSLSPSARFFHRYLGPLAFITSEQGAQTVLYCAFEEEVAKETGHYYKNCSRDDNMTNRVNDADASRLWTLSHELCSLVNKEEKVRIKIDV